MAAETLEQALRKVPILSDLTDDQLAWLAVHCEDVSYEAGEIVIRPGEPAEHMLFMLEGEVEARMDSGGPELPTYIAKAGMVTGLLPHSRMKKFERTARTVTAARAALLHKRHFDQMFDAIPELEPRLIGVMADRIRETTRADLQHEKLAALGKLSAGLAHELNNPAAALRRGSDGIREKLAALREVDCRLAQFELTPPQRQLIATLEEEAAGAARDRQPLDALTRSDREEALGEELSRLGVADPWELAPELVGAGITGDRLKSLVACVGLAAGAALARISILASLEALAGEMHDSASRMSELVSSIREYSYMDTAAERDIDIHRGLETTLTMLSHRLKKGISVERRYDPALPSICAHGGELNQVWTNLIDNAIDSMLGAGDTEKVLGVKTGRRGESVLVEISDTGPGIPPEIRDRIFEPFFTTKKQGEGTGLGLDLAFRIVRKHHGDLRFESRPGATCFQVRLPLRRPVGPV